MKLEVEERILDWWCEGEENYRANMDLANLEKWKVAELRQELQSRGLDTKGIKAILIDRLRTHLSGGGKFAT